MFSVIFNHEINYWFRKPSFYLYLGIFLIASIITATISVGFFSAAASSVDAVLYANSPLKVSLMYGTFSNLIFFLLPLIIGVTINKDTKSDMHMLLYSLPINKLSYLSAKFLSAFLIVNIILLSVAIGLIIGFTLPGTNDALVYEFNATPYLHVYLLYFVPNALSFGAATFAVVSLTRNITAGFVMIIIVVLLQGVLVLSFTAPDYKELVAILDPFGAAALRFYTEYWTIEENNTLSLPIGKFIILNRLFWLSISSVLLIAAYYFFSFSQHGLAGFSKKRRDAKALISFQNKVSTINLSTFKSENSLFSYIKMVWRLAATDFLYIIKSWPFVAIALAGFVILLIDLSQKWQFRGTFRLPMTWMIVDFSEAFIFSIHVCCFLYAGMLINRGKFTQMDQIIDATPVPNWMLTVSKILALLKTQLLLLSMVMISGIVYQIWRGYYHFEIGHYLFELFVLYFLYFTTWTLLGFFVQTFIKNFYVGLFLMIVILIGTPLLRKIGVDQAIFRYGDGGGIAYSPMNNFDEYLPSYFMYKTYWIVFGILLSIIAGQLIVRGIQESFIERIKLAKNRISKTTILSLGVFTAIFISFGFKIYHDENIKNIKPSSKQIEAGRANWELKYKRFEHYPQPKVTSVKTNVNIYPHKLSMDANGTYVLLNKTDQPIDSIFIQYNGNPGSFDFNKSGDIVNNDSLYYFAIYKLDNSLIPGDSIVMSFTVSNKPNTLMVINSFVKRNGTFFNNREVFPIIGYLPGKELTDEIARKSYDLPPRKKLAHPLDTSALTQNALAIDADWVDFETIVSTSSDQIAIAPGYLQKEWLEGNRKFFHYKMDIKMLHFYAYNSARYEVERDNWNGVNLEIFYQKGHEFNLDRMMDGMKSSLSYCSENFSPYQHKQARIVEFPRTEGSFAQAFPNTIPFSESHGFVADVDDSDEGGIDYPFAVTAHEIAHQWWAHQVIGANVLGATMLSESLAEYVRLKVLEHKYGKSKMRKFLKYSLDRYLRSRSNEKIGEEALMYNSGQTYIRYSKGAVVFYALSDYLGEKNLNKALSDFVLKNQFQEPPYTTTLDLKDHLEKITPDSLKYILTDMLETVTLYDNKVKSASSKKLENGQYEVTIQFKVSKYRNDEKGNKFYGLTMEDDSSISDENGTKSVILSDYIDIGIFGTEKVDGKSKETELYLSKHKITGVNNKISIIVSKLPTEVGIDPYNKLIDTNSRDNRLKL